MGQLNRYSSIYETMPLTERNLDFIIKNAIKFEWNDISSNPNITMKMIEKYQNNPWNWSYISINKAITMETINKYPNKPWDWKYISSNPNLTMAMIEKYPNNDWNWEILSHNPNLTIEIINKYPDKPWHFGKLQDHIFEKSAPLKKPQISEKPKTKWWRTIYKKIQCHIMPQKQTSNKQTSYV